MSFSRVLPDLGPGRLGARAPVAVIDIGSNSVRLVAYEGLTRSPTPIFNEKALCGLGRSVASTGRLDEQSVARALAALRRFRTLCDIMRVEGLYVLATAAARDAENGAEFLAAAREICGVEVELISGKREARLAALGVVSGVHRPDGLVGDLGGGSLELVEVHGARIGAGITLPIGGLRLQDASARSMKRAEKLVREAMASAPQLKAGEGRSFYAVGGTWRALAKLHMKQHGYPLHVMHGYTLPAREALEFSRLIRRVDPETLDSIEAVSSERRPLLAYGALVLEHIVRQAKPKDVVISALGVREGLLYELLDESEHRQDPLIAAARELGVLRSRSARHGDDLIAWSDRFFATCHLEETADEKRLRHAACLLADIGWRAHPDYRGEQTLNIIAHAAFVGIDHPGRAYLALAVSYRHLGVTDEAISPRIRELASSRIIDRARILGAAMRVGYLVSAAMPDVLPRTPLEMAGEKLVLTLPPDLGTLASDRLQTRLKQLARLINREPVVAIGEGVEA